MLIFILLYLILMILLIGEACFFGSESMDSPLREISPADPRLKNLNNWGLLFVGADLCICPSVQY